MKNKIIQEDIDSITSSNLPWDKFRGKSVLVTGANGFLPSYMVYTLLELNSKFNLNIRISALVRNREKANLKFSDCYDREDFRLIVQDVTPPLPEHISFDYIIHAASQASPKYYGVDPVGTSAPNVIGTYNLLELARKSGCEGFLFFSSSEVYGNVQPDQIPTCENDLGKVDPALVRSCYAESKRMGENLCVSFSHQYGVPVKIVRPFHTYGPGMELNDGRVYADFISDILENKNIVMKSDGKAVRAFCYSADATTGFFTALLLGGNSEAYNIGNADGTSTISDLAETLVTLFPEKKLSVEKWKPPVDGSYLPSSVSVIVPNTSKINSLGWNAGISVKTGFQRTIKSYSNAE